MFIAVIQLQFNFFLNECFSVECSVRFEQLPWWHENAECPTTQTRDPTSCHAHKVEVWNRAWPCDLGTLRHEFHVPISNPATYLCYAWQNTRIAFLYTSRVILRSILCLKPLLETSWIIFLNIQFIIQKDTVQVRIGFKI